MADTDPVPITDENAVAHAIAAAIHDITKQGLPGHGHEIVNLRLIRPASVVRASVAYAKARDTGKTERGAVRDAAIELVRNYRFQHNL
ncbi:MULTISPECIES: hypothetical protein [unclassified Streptomyces]|uniref:hypothetical protein n=1 Tax=unclassified Streptomyces TaxID=2593676 RepID=UPI00365D29B4